MKERKEGSKRRKQKKEGKEGRKKGRKEPGTRPQVWDEAKHPEKKIKKSIDGARGKAFYRGKLVKKLAQIKPNRK